MFFGGFAWFRRISVDEFVFPARKERVALALGSGAGFGGDG
ncbi:MAG: hypothetical protein ABW023_01120 [Sphingomonas sp.]